MPRGWCLAAIILITPVAAYLAVEAPDADRNTYYPQQYLRIIHNQLHGLKTQLLDYRRTHGCYPTNDEGLAALDNYAARFAVPVDLSAGGSVDTLPEFLGNRGESMFTWSRPLIADYRRSHGHVPLTFDELYWPGMGYGPVPASGKPGVSEAHGSAAALEIAIGREDDIYLVTPAGVLSPWLVPYLYENRQGLDARLFEGSPADGDTHRRYSVQVDDGVFVSSIGGQDCARQFDAARRDNAWPRILGLVLLAVPLGCVVVLIRTSRRWAAAGLGALVLAGATGGLAQYSMGISCYGASQTFIHRDPYAAARQKTLLDDFHRRGVLGDAAHARAVAALAAPDSPAGAE